MQPCHVLQAIIVSMVQGMTASPALWVPTAPTCLLIHQKIVSHALQANIVDSQDCQILVETAAWVISAWVMQLHQHQMME